MAVLCQSRLRLAGPRPRRNGGARGGGGRRWAPPFDAEWRRARRVLEHLVEVFRADEALTVEVKVAEEVRNEELRIGHLHSIQDQPSACCSQGVTGQRHVVTLPVGAYRP